MEVLEEEAPAGQVPGEAGEGVEEEEEEEEEEAEEENENHLPFAPELQDNPTSLGEDGEDSEGELVEEEEDGLLYHCKVLFFFCRIVVLLSVVFTGLFNLSSTPGRDSTLWTALLSSCVGYALSVRKLKGRKRTVRRRRRRRPPYHRHYRLGAQDGGLDFLHTLAKQQFNARVS